MTKQRYKVPLDTALWQRVRVRAVEQGVTAGDVIEEALARYLDGDPVAAPVPPPRPAPPPPIPDPNGEHVLGDIDEIRFGQSQPAPKPRALDRSGPPHVRRPVGA